MKNPAFFAVLIVLIFGIIYVMKGSDNPPETSMTQSPKDYIEMVERKKAARLSVERSLQQSEDRTRQGVQDGEAQR